HPPPERKLTIFSAARRLLCPPPSGTLLGALHGSRTLRAREPRHTAMTPLGQFGPRADRATHIASRRGRTKSLSASITTGLDSMILPRVASLARIQLDLPEG